MNVKPPTASGACQLTRRKDGTRTRRRAKRVSRSVNPPCYDERMGAPEPSRDEAQRPSQHFSRRVVVRGMLLLAAGAMANIAVAWACARWSHPQRNPTWQSHNAQSVYVADPFGRFSGRSFYVEMFRSFGGMCIRCTSEGLVDEGEHRRFVASQIQKGALVKQLDLPSWSSASELERSKTPMETRLREDAFGWPLLTLRCYYERELRPPRGPELKMLHEGIVLPDLIVSPGGMSSGFAIPVGLPLRPIWPSFAVNTAFYAVVIGTLFIAPIAMRRMRRRARGLCPRCAYDLRGRSPQSRACPECGAATPQPTTPA